MEEEEEKYIKDIRFRGVPGKRDFKSTLAVRKVGHLNIKTTRRHAF